MRQSTTNRVLVGLPSTYAFSFWGSFRNKINSGVKETQAWYSVGNRDGAVWKSSKITRISFKYSNKMKNGPFLSMKLRRKFKVWDRYCMRFSTLIRI